MTERSREERAAFRAEVVARRAAKAAQEAVETADDGGNNPPDDSAAAIMVRFSTALWGRRWYTEAAECMGVSVRTVHRWMKGHGEPDARSMAYLVKEARLRLRQLHAVLHGDVAPSAQRAFLVDGPAMRGGM
jgi:hypothetical protein